MRIHVTIGWKQPSLYHSRSSSIWNRKAPLQPDASSWDKTGNSRHLLSSYVTHFPEKLVEASTNWITAALKISQIPICPSSHQYKCFNPQTGLIIKCVMKSGCEPRTASGSHLPESILGSKLNLQISLSFNELLCVCVFMYLCVCVSVCVCVCVCVYVSESGLLGHCWKPNC